ncbi:MAG: hypothetical protein JW981_11120 [Anaerolineae bacterium]|nr:hypothetical protein [Anaerolineae bacterium]
MQIPDGRECPYYVIDYHRRATPKEICHLLEGQPDAMHWTSELCATCPVPDIQRANGCSNMVLTAHIGKRPWRFWERERILVKATCTYTEETVKNPYVGCGHCHTAFTFVVGEPSEEIEKE